MEKISVICPVFNEEKYISSCLNSLLVQDFSWEGSEIMFIDGFSTDKTRPILKDYTSKYSFIKLFDNPKKNASAALNIGLRNSRNEIIFRIDAHTIYPKNYFTVLIYYLIKLKADNVGGVCRTLPDGLGLIPSIIAKAMSSLFGMGNSFFRIGSTKIKKVDTVPFGCFRKEIFNRIGFFDEELIRNQDDEFNGRIIKNGGSIYIIPEIIVDYFARNNIVKMSQMFYQYGLYKPLVNKKLKRPATLRQFFPFLFVNWIILGFLYCIINNSFLFFYFGLIFTYFILGYIFSLKESENFFQFILLPFIFFIIHVCYGWGYIKGTFQFLVFRFSTINLEINR